MAAHGRLAAPILLAAALLIVPIMLWATLGDGTTQRSLEVALGAALLSWAVARRAEDRGAAAAPPEPRSPARPIARTPTTTCDSEQRRAKPAKRPARNLGCHAAERSLEQRTPRRRTRP
jgi:hypothetical protein